MDKKMVIKWLTGNIFAVVAAIVAIINLWAVSKLLPLEARINANAHDIAITNSNVSSWSNTTIELMRNISDIKADVNYIRGKLEK